MNTSPSTGRRVYAHYDEEAFLRQGLEGTGFDIVGCEQRQLPSPDGDVELFFDCLRGWIQRTRSTCCRGLSAVDARASLTGQYRCNGSPI